MISKKTRNILTKVAKTEQEINNSLSLLPKIQIIGKDIVLNKKQQEIILAENYFLGASSFVSFYQFNNLDIKYLHFFHPSMILSTTDGFQFENMFFTNLHWWEGLEDNLILKFRIGGYILIYQDEMWQSNLAPVYLTAKIYVHNPRIFDLLTVGKK